MASSANLSASITMTDQASAVLAKVRGESEPSNATAGKGSGAATGFGASWMKAAAAAGVAAIGVSKLKDLLGEAMQAAMDDQKSVTALGQALNNLGMGSANAELQAWVKNVQMATGASDDLLRNGLVRIISATKDVATAEQAMTLALDIQAGGYADAEGAAKALSAAYMGNTTALRKLKLPISAAALESKDMTRITKELSTLVGGQAAAAAETYAGKMLRVNTAVAEAKENLGYGLLRAVDGVSNALGGADGAVSLIDEMGTAMRHNGEGIAVVVEGLSNFNSQVMNLIPGLSDLNEELGITVNWADALGQGSLGAVGSAIELVTATVDHSSEAFAKLASETDGVTASFRDANGVDHVYIGGIEQVTSAQQAAAQQSEELQAWIDEIKASADAAAKRVTVLAGAMGLLETRAQQREALRSFKSATEEFIAKPSVDAALKMRSEFQNAFDSFKDGSKKQAQFVIDNYATIRDAIKNSGMSKAAQRELIEPLNQARQAAKNVISTLNLLDGKRVEVSVVLSQLGAAAQYVTTNKALGGYVSGPGTGTSDSIPAMLSNGEYVIKASAVRSIGINNLHALNAMGYKDGGGVSVFGPKGPKVPWTVWQGTGMYGPKPAAPFLGDKLATDNYNRADVAREAARAAAEAAQAAKEAADAAARAAEELSRQQQQVIGVARDLLQQALETRDDFAKGIASTSIGFGSISGFDPGSSDWAALSMRAPGSDGAGGPATAGGLISAYMQGKLNRIRSFGQVIKSLTQAGLNYSTLRDVINAGPDQGTTLGQALLDAGVGEINTINGLQASIEDASGGIGAYAANTIYGGGVMDANGNYVNVVGANGGVDQTPLQVNLMLDGQTVVTQLLAIKRQRGGVSLGLA